MSEQITDLEMVVKTLKEKVDRLRIEETQLQSSIHSQTLRFEAQKKLEDVNSVNKDNIRKLQLDAKEAKIVEREEQASLVEKGVADRVRMVDEREQRHVYLEKQFENLNRERKDFEEKRREQLRELDRIKEETAIFLAKEKMLEGKEDGLRGREKAVKQKELFIQDETGRLTEWENKIKKDIEHLEGLKKELSYAG